MEALIVFRIGSEHIGVDINKVREVADAQAPVAVPQSPDFVKGLVNIRGEVIPVVSLRRRMHMEGDDVGNKLLVVEDAGHTAGLLVDELLGTEKIKKKKINRRANLLSTRKRRQFFSGLYETGDKPILILDTTKALSKEET
jgi:purine-binding chemotaxis protein CheW